MNPREFCSLSGYTAALFLTYDFDPIFFERVVLRELWAGGTGDIIVVADQSRIDASLDRWSDRLVHLGRRYQLIPASVEGAFHPKVILRAGPEGVIAWVGSGNLTFGGWGGNREMSAAWTLGENDSAWIRSLMKEIDMWSPGGATHDVFRRIRDLPSMSTLMLSEGLGPTPVLLARAGDPISNQIARRWNGRHFEEARILAGSTDRDGAFLHWLHDVFGVQRAMVAVDPNRASFDPALLNKLPVLVETLETGFDSPLHAKLCWLSGSGGSVAVMGSANCSRSAWLRDPAHGGNVEVVAVYDQVSQRFADETFTIFNDARIYTPRPPAQQEADVREGGPRYRVQEITWEPRDSELTIRFIRAIPKGARVEVIVDRRKAKCHSVSSSDLSVWLAFLPLEENALTRFADVTLFLDDSEEDERQRHWVNNHEELIHAAQGRQIEDVFDGMRRRSMPTEQRRILRELHRIGAVLLTELHAFPDPGRAAGSHHERDKEQTAEITPVDPETLVRSLDDALVRRWPTHGGGGVGFSLVGVMRALFPEQPPAIDDDEVAEVDSPPVPKRPSSGAPKELIPEPVQRRLRWQMEKFIGDFSDPAFAASCSARQLVQAAAYPLAVGIVGTRGGWVSGGDAVSWAQRIFDTLFQKRPLPSGRHSGILEGVRQRLTDEGKEKIFREVVGDGTLWLTLLTSLSLEEWSGSSAAFEWALALRDVCNAHILLSSTDKDKMARLITRAEWDSGALLLKAARVARALDALENALESDWDALLQSQKDAPIVHEPDDLLWSPKAGWAVAQEKAVAERATKLNVYLRLKAQVVRVVAAGFYVNVTKATEFRTELDAVLS